MVPLRNGPRSSLFFFFFPMLSSWGQNKWAFGDFITPMWVDTKNSLVPVSILNLSPPDLFFLLSVIISLSRSHEKRKAPTPSWSAIRLKTQHLWPFSYVGKYLVYQYQLWLSERKPSITQVQVHSQEKDKYIWICNNFFSDFISEGLQLARQSEGTSPPKVSFQKKISSRPQPHR